LLAQIGHIRYPLLAGVCLLAVLALLNVRVSAPPPASAPLVRVRWTPAVGPAEQAARESALRLRRGEPHGDRTWSYDLLDTSPTNIRAVVTDPAVEDTDGIDRQRFRLNLPQVTIAERLTAAFPGLERAAGPGLGKWLSPENAWPALLAFAWLVTIVRPSARTLIFRGIPSLSPTGLGLFRVALGLWLLVSVPGVLELPGTALPMELHRAADGFADWMWVHWLALHPEANSLVLTIALVALALFAAGVAPRVTYTTALAALTVRVFVVLQYRSAHDIGLPLVALWGLVLVPWDAGLMLVPRQPVRETRDTALGYAIWWPGAALGLALLAAAYAKLDTSGLGWALGGAAKYHFVEDFARAPTTWGLWVATQPVWAVVASCGAVAIEGLVVIHLFFRHWLVRAAAGLAVLALLAGLYLLQGHFWPLWWGMLLAFVPWDVLARMLRAADPRAFVPHSAIPKYATQFVTALVCVQLFASARRVEVEPFVSDYGMYSWTWPSTDAFDRQISRKYRVYHYVVASEGETLDITDRLRALPRAIDTLADAVDRLREGSGLASSDREALRTVGAMYQSAFSVPISELTVFRDEQAFDWQRGRFYQSANHEPTGTIDLSNGEFNGRGHEWRQ
jgi:hypothetical protein